MDISIAAAPDPEVEIYVLGGSVVVRVGGREQELDDQRDQWLLMALAMSGRRGIVSADARRALGINQTALRQAISRLRVKTRLDWRIEPVHGRGYRLDMGGVWVDVQEFLRLVETPEPDEVVRRASLRQARSMLTDTIPKIPDYPPPHAVTQLAFRNAERTVRSGGRRILIVDDQIGETLAERLRVKDHECEVAVSYDEYLPFERRLGDFDLVIIDRHLVMGGYDDALGDQIVERINKRPDAIPVFMITFDVPDHMDFTALREKYGLAGAKRKRVDGEGADLNQLVSVVEQIFLDGAENQACEAIEAGMTNKRRRADKRLCEKYAEPRLTAESERMKKEAKEVEAIAAMNNLQKARTAQRAFVASWLDGRY